MGTITPEQVEGIGEAKAALVKEFLAAEPPAVNGEKLLELWDKIFDDAIKSVVVETVNGPSDDSSNPVFPYEKLQAVVGDGGNWKWPRMWQKLDELERRGTAYRSGEACNFDQPNKNPNIVPQNILVVGGGPVGLRMAIELKLGGHKVTIFEKRREQRNDKGDLEVLGFTNRINRPHMWPFVRHDLARLNGKDFMSGPAAYPVFTEPDTSSIGIDELQILLMKNALMMGVDFRLGVGYDDAKVVQDPKTARPRWNVELSADKEAAAKFGYQEGKNNQTFDVLIGCDGPRSTVRATQTKYLGTVEKRKFMDCVGIVANVRKVPRKRLKELGFEFGQEPKDMNRTKMVFKSFFDKIRDEADAELENFIYYKASFHYYCILTPKKADMVKHELSGQVYLGAFSNRGAGISEEKLRDKKKLKDYCTRVLKAAGIPIDETQENDGFVNEPNDCMAFDFAECWNTKQSMAFNLPPEDYNTAEHGPWVGKKLYPPVILAGDALLEPFWPMGLGLKRGWQAIMDTCYAVDNLYNRTFYAKELEKEPDMVSWDDHYEKLWEHITQNFELCNRLQIAEELGRGEYEEKGLVIQQMKKRMKDPEKPPYEPEIDPITRYAPLLQVQNKLYNQKALDDKDWNHPKVAKEIAKKAYYDEIMQGCGARGEIIYKGKKLISIEGKTVEAVKSGYTFKAPQRKSVAVLEPPPEAKKPVIPIEEVKRKSNKLTESLTAAIMARQIDDHVGSRNTARRGSKDLTQLGCFEDTNVMHEIGHSAGSTKTDSVAEQAQAMWDRAHEKHLSPSQEAELAHIRHMIEALSKSLATYKQAEKDMLMGGK
mmetsp:Transcript_41888/g.66539  ORF Transcript_41888/g.66539 Transcript_41888/m.66539 type:complete len:824 (-) Transcript_41888:181-2652(-)